MRANKLQSVRRRVLLRSVQRLLPSEPLHGVAMLWRLHDRALPITVVAAVLAAVIGLAAGLDRVALALATAATAAAAAGLTREFRVLALTDDGFVLLRGSTIRVQAKEVIERLGPRAEIIRLGGSLLTAEWRVAGRTYTVRREWERSMQEMASRAKR